MAGNPSIVTQAMVEQFNTNLHFTPNQREPRLLGLVRREMQKGTESWFDVITDVEPETKIGRMPVAQFNELEIFKKRAVNTATGFKNHWMDEEDDIGLIINPNFPVLQRINHALANWIDDQIIAAATGSAFERVLSGGTYTRTEVAYDTTNQQVAVTLGAASGNAGMNLRKLIEADSIFGTNDVDSSMGYGRKVMVMSQKELNDLALEAKAVGEAGDYAAFRAIQNNETNQFRGFTMVRSQRLGIASNVRTCFAYYERGIIYSTAEGTKATIKEDPTRDDAVKIRGTTRGGATRIDDKLVVSIPCDTNESYNGA